ncbi:MAG: ABC transporter ATP-binding protein [Rhodobacteraceae bacterium]|nr:ABC transporter ATP-binding protein [Paracoccaceae bacterium]
MSSSVSSDPQPLIEMVDVSKDYALGGLLQKAHQMRALSHISLALRPGRALAMVGESGSGKSTTARLICRATQPSSGDILFRGKSILEMDRKASADYRRDVQMIFQDPFGSLNPALTVGHHITRPLRIHNPDLTRAELRDRALAVLEEVGLRPSADYLARSPHELSGGQRQRVAIARALSVGPSVLLADEPTSMLDVSVRLGILNLLQDTKERGQVAVLYITHDIATARYFAEDTAVLYAGHVVEQAPSQTITERPAHPYTQLLIASVPNPEKRITPSSARRAVDIPIWTAESKGCPFVSRCPRASDICRATMPTPTQIDPSHVVSCHHL